MNDWPEEVPIPFDHELVPPSIREAVAGFGTECQALHRVVTADGVEWWLFDGKGDLIESLWLE